MKADIHPNYADISATCSAVMSSRPVLPWHKTSASMFVPNATLSTPASKKCWTLVAASTASNSVLAVLPASKQLCYQKSAFIGRFFYVRTVVGRLIDALVGTSYLAYAHYPKNKGTAASVSASSTLFFLVERPSCQTLKLQPSSTICRHAQAKPASS